MATIRQVRQRIRVAKNIQQITKAMKMVAAARLKRAQEHVQAARPYAQSLREIMTSVASAAGGEVQHPLLEQRDTKVVAFFIVTSDRGLAGSYNSTMFRRAAELLRHYDKANVRLYIVGRKGIQFFSRRGYNVAGQFSLGSVVTIADARNIAGTLRTAFESGEVDQVTMLYTRFYTAITQKAVDVQLLPIQTPAAADASETQQEDFIFEPDAGRLLASLLPRYLEGQVFQALLESSASEHGSRMTAMSSATDNAGKMIQTLTLQMNRVRQANITREISEIVGGAEALKG